MNTSLNKVELAAYVSAQLGHFFPDGNLHEKALSVILPNTLKRLDYCFSHINRKYYQEVDANAQTVTCFNHLNSDHYASFLYLLSNEAWLSNEIPLAEKLFYLNKSLNGLDCFYSVELPRIFMFVHPVGTVLGNANYQDYLVVYQNVTVGSTTDGEYPSFGRGCILYSKSSVIGNCKLGEDVVIGANSSLINYDVGNHQSVVGQYPDHKILSTKINVVNDVFTDIDLTLG